VIALALALQLFATAPADSSGPGPTPPAPGAPKFAQLVSLTGVPPDSSMRTEFLAAFRGVFMEDEVPGERLSAAREWKQGLPLPNRFRLLEGSLADDAWKLDIVIGSPPPLRRRESGDRSARTVPTRRMSRGMVAALVMRVPDPSGGVPRTVQTNFAFVFPAAGAGATDLAVPATGYAYPWSRAGRVVGSLVLEALHRESGDIVDSERMDIRPAVRSESGR
jgi:hypothetical protein